MYQIKHLNDKNNAKQGETQKEIPFSPNSAISKRTSVLLGMAVSTIFICNSSAYAQTSNALINANKSNTPVIDAQNQAIEDQSATKINTLAKLTVSGEGDENSTYSAGQLSYENNAGFLGIKDFLDTPFSAINYTNKFISDQQATDITDIIAATDPSVYSSGAGGQNLESYSIRGFASNSNDMTVNGLSGMAPYYRSSPEMFERVEVLKGPSALLNGMAPSGSVGGAVNLVTKRAGDEPFTRLTTRYISDSQIGGHLDVSRRFGENKEFGVRINGAYLNGDSAVNTQEKESKLGSIALDWRGERARLSADIYHTIEHVVGPTRGITLAAGVAIPKAPDPETLLNPSWAFYETQTDGVITRGEFDVNDQLTVYAALGANKMEFKGFSAANAQVYNSDGDIRTTLGYVADDNERVSMEMGLNGHFNTGNINHQIASNIIHYNEEYNLKAKYFQDQNRIPTYINNTNIYNPVWGEEPALDFYVPLLLTTETNLTSYGLADTLSFAQDKYQLTLGVRYQQVKTEQTGGLFSSGTKYDESAITPSIAFVTKMTDQISLYANYIEGLSKGDTAPRGTENEGEIFSPYKTKQKEIGIKIDRNEFTHTVSIYEIEKPNSYTDTVTNIFSYAGEQRNRGIEWGFAGSLVENIRLMGGVTYIDARLTKTKNGAAEGNQASGIPKWQSKVGVEWDLSFVQNLTLTANANSVSKQYLGNDNSESLSAHTILNLGARYATYVNQIPLTIRANITNVTNKAYWATAHYNDLALGNPRTLMVSATIDF
ncbi:MAG: TonB-dependent siderophore receptor [Gammaproteobacteria bacterium]|nr:TonB-dependent siderophore receptor [Gammaproteobacteria bacterium]